jgi:hypothetical protein
MNTIIMENIFCNKTFKLQKALRIIDESEENYYNSKNTFHN